MNEPSTNPFVIALFFIGRCMIPVAVLIGISYLLRKLGLVVIETPVDPDEDMVVGEPDQPLEESIR